MFTRSALFSFICLSLGAAGCAGEAKDPVEEAPEESALSGKTDHGGMIVGALTYGETSGHVRYQAPPAYRILTFEGRPGDQVTVDVRASGYGDAVAWLLDGSFQVIAANDDAGPHTLDARLGATLPGSPDNTYYIVFRDYYYQTRYFRVSLAGERPGLPCERDADCAGVETGPFESALCLWETRTCEVVPVDEIQCGGFRINPHGCPAGFECVGDGLARDLPGDCRQTCGDGLGVTCREGFSCQDNPYDACDPADGDLGCTRLCLPL